MQPTRCPDLPPDLLREISCRIHDVADFVRFHAVCKPWRESYELSTRKKTTDDHFMPWLLAPNRNIDDSLMFRCVFSKCSYRAPPPSVSDTGKKNWVASADGTAVRYFTAGPALTDHLTGDVTHLPLFPDGQWEEENPSGITYDDGTVLLYRNYKNIHGETDEFRAALLHPDDDEWTVVHRTLESPYVGGFSAAYHAGKILATVQRRVWKVVTPMPRDDVLILTPSSMPLNHGGYFYVSGHVLESGGELLWATVHLNWDYWKGHRKGVSDPSRFLLVMVHTLEEARWVLKKGISLANLVLFLGSPNSFAVDASRVGINGGFVYFMHFCSVYRYSLIDNTTEFIDWRPEGWSHQMCTWLLPQPTIAPIHRGRATTPRSNKMIHIERHCSPLPS